MTIQSISSTFDGRLAFSELCKWSGKFWDIRLICWRASNKLAGDVLMCLTLLCMTCANLESTTCYSRGDGGCTIRSVSRFIWSGMISRLLLSSRMLKTLLNDSGLIEEGREKTVILK